MQYKRKMGIDYGDKRIGIALTDALCIISSPYEVYKNVGQEDAIEHIIKLIKDYDVDEIAMGLPLNMDGTEGERAIIHRQFGEKLESLSGVKVYYIDERLTSAEAEEILISSGVRREKRKELIDKISAQIILQTYINTKKRGSIFMENQNNENSTRQVDLLDVLLDQDNKEPIVLMDENGKQMTFEQVAVIPYEVRKEKRLYCVLKPLDKIEGIGDDEAIVFLVDTDDEGNSIIRIEEDEEIAIAVFDKYYDLLEEARKEAATEKPAAKAPSTSGKKAAGKK